MSTKPKLHRSPSWYVQVAEGMARNGLSLKEAAHEIGLELDLSEVSRLQRDKEFQEILRNEENKYAAAVANDPSRTKSVAIGKMWLMADKLEREGDHEKAAVVIEKIAKMEGWAGAEGNVNIFSGLTAKDIQEAKARISQTTAIRKPELLN